MNTFRFIKKNKTYFIAVLLVIVFMLIGRFITTIDFVKLKKYVLEMPVMIGGVLLVSTFAYISSTVAWWLCLGKGLGKITFPELFAFKHVGEMLTVFNPTGIIAGDGLKATYIFQKGVDKKGIKFHSVVQSIGYFIGYLPVCYFHDLYYHQQDRS